MKKGGNNQLFAITEIVIMKNIYEEKNMLNFTIGPVQSNDYVLEIGSKHTPYFRTSEFSELMLENENLMKEFVNATDDSRVAFLTGSGTAAMEAAVLNLFNKNDKILVVNGGSFGERFSELCQVHGLDYTEIALEQGKTIKTEELSAFSGKGYTGLLVNVHETSTGVYYDLNIIGEFCRKNSIFLVVDAISSFLADPLDMEKVGAGAIITASQKALACPPGVSIIILSQDAIDRINRIDPKCVYLNLKDALDNGKRGQTPYTPAVTILLQINARLNYLKKNGGVNKEIERIKALAEDFRGKISELPFRIASERLSNAMTPLQPITQSANEIFLKLKDEYSIWVCPNGGKLKDSLFRVGHIGALTFEDNEMLITALKDLKEKNFI